MRVDLLSGSRGAKQTYVRDFFGDGKDAGDGVSVEHRGFSDTYRLQVLLSPALHFSYTEYEVRRRLFECCIGRENV